MGIALAVISWIATGIVIAVIVRALMRGDRPYGRYSTLAMGVVGAIVGGFIGGIFAGGVADLLETPWSPWTVAFSILGALFFTIIYAAASRRNP